MCDERKHIALRVAERIEPAAAMVGDDDDLGGAAELDGTRGALLFVDRETRFGKDQGAADFFPQFLNFCSLHSFPIDFDRPRLSLLPVISRAASVRREEQRRQGRGWQLMNLTVRRQPAAAKPPLPPRARKRQLRRQSPSMSRPGKEFVDDFEVVIPIDFV